MNLRYERFKAAISLLVASILGATGCGEKGIDTPVPPVEYGDGPVDVIYEANPKLFGRGKAFNEIAADLDRIGDLGTTVLWLMPVYPEGSLNSVGSPYCVRDYRQVNSDYGSMDEFKSLVTKAHNSGMKVILDWVANHTAWDCSWIEEHPDWYTTDASGNIIPPAGTGWNDVADLNYGNAQMRSEMAEAMKWWISETGIDGFRCDAADYVPNDFWKEAIKGIRSIKNDALMLAESSDKNLYEAGFDILYGWSFNSKLVSTFNGKTSLSNLYETIRNEEDGLEEGQEVMRFITNHDIAMNDGAPVTIFKSTEGALAAFVVTAFSGGIPMIYSSQETGWASSVNFFKFIDIDWNENTAYTENYKSVMKI
ncbi:MAG: alpha-amylase family glycosyl hydrolase, partial [Candidatus Cryptobacteroides sp.]